MPKLWTCLLYQRINTQHATCTPRNRLTSLPIFIIARRFLSNRYPIPPSHGEIWKCNFIKIYCFFQHFPPNHDDRLSTIVIHKLKILANAPHSYSSLMSTTEHKNFKSRNARSTKGRYCSSSKFLYNAHFHKNMGS
jgi:hypothetical protein